MFSNRVLPFLVLVLLFIFSCKKEAAIVEIEDTRAMDDRMAMIQHNWAFDLFTHEETMNGTTTNDSIIGVSGDFFEFSKNDSVYAFFNGQPDTVGYSLVDLNHIQYANDIFEIVTLTNSDFVFTINRDTDSTKATDQILLSR